MTKSPEEIINEAIEAGRKAAIAYNATLPPENKRGFDCGFAWVKVFPARGPFVTYCKKKGIGSRAYNGGYEFWYSVFSIGTQSISVHEAAAIAFAKVLKDNGLTAYVGSRLD